ncbi:MAG TPA: UrcA family protein [Sphingomicrobium sp.]|jgi:UrcA family protein|nr:UrcA family protein [Sphingomicrobium sp.]
MKTIPALAAVAAAATLVVPTVSRADAPTSAVVPYADLNLLSPNGQTVLQRRIAQAADSVCEVGYSRDLARVHAADRCRVGAIAGAHEPFMAAIEASRRGTVTVLDAAALVITAQ